MKFRASCIMVVFALIAVAGAAPFAAAQDPVTAVFAHVAIGGGYTTVFTFANTGVDNVNGKLILTDHEGNPLRVNLVISLSSPAINPSLEEGGFEAVDSMAPVAVRSGGVQILTATAIDPSGPTQTGWARVESTGGSLSGVATFEYSPTGSLQTIAGVLSSNTTPVATIPVSNETARGRQTGFAVANPSATDTINLRVVPVRTDGSQAGSFPLPPLPPGAQTATFLYQVNGSIFNNFKGSAVLIEASGKSFAVVALVQADGQTGPIFTAIPVIPEKSIGVN